MKVFLFKRLWLVAIIVLFYSNSFAQSSLGEDFVDLTSAGYATQITLRGKFLPNSRNFATQANYAADIVAYIDNDNGDKHVLFSFHFAQWVFDQCNEPRNAGVRGWSGVIDVPSHMVGSAGLKFRVTVNGSKMRWQNSPHAGGHGGLHFAAPGLYLHTSCWAGFGSFRGIWLEISPDYAPEATKVLVNTTEARNDKYSVKQGELLTKNVLNNDIDDQNDNLAVNARKFTTSNGGKVVLKSDGILKYTPSNSFLGKDVFTYEMCDDGVPESVCDSASIEITVKEPDNTTVANNDTAVTYPNTEVNGNLLTNDTDKEGDAQNANNGTFNTKQGGEIFIEINGDFVYTPPLNYVGNDSFEYTVCDNGSPNVCDTATITITVNSPPDFVPVLKTSNSSVTGNEGDIDFVVIIAEISNKESSNVPVIVSIPKASMLTLSFNENLKKLNKRNINNSKWEFLDSNPFFYRFRYKDGKFPPNGSKSFGVHAKLRPPLGSKSKFTLLISVNGKSGSQLNTSNDTDMDVLTYSNN